MYEAFSFSLSLFLVEGAFSPSFSQQPLLFPSLSVSVAASHPTGMLAEHPSTGIGRSSAPTQPSTRHPHIPSLFNVLAWGGMGKGPLHRLAMLVQLIDLAIPGATVDSYPVETRYLGRLPPVERERERELESRYSVWHAIWSVSKTSRFISHSQDAAYLFTSSQNPFRCPTRTSAIRIAVKALK